VQISSRKDKKRENKFVLTFYFLNKKSDEQPDPSLRFTVCISQCRSLEWNAGSRNSYS